MFRLVVRGEWAIVLPEVGRIMGMGRFRAACIIKAPSSSFSSGEAASDGPFGDETRDRRRAGDERAASFNPVAC